MKLGGYSLKKLEGMFEGLLWNSCLVVIAAVVASLLTSIGVFYVATVEACYMLSHLAAGIALFGLALYLSHASEAGHGKTT